MLPRNSIAWSASTRPRISGVASIWTIDVDAVRNAMLAMPSRMPNANASNWFGATVINAIAAPYPSDASATVRM